MRHGSYKAWTVAAQGLTTLLNSGFRPPPFHPHCPHQHCLLPYCWTPWALSVFSFLDLPAALDTLTSIFFLKSVSFSERNSSFISEFFFADVLMHALSHHRWPHDAPLGFVLNPLLPLLPMLLADVPFYDFQWPASASDPSQSSLLCPRPLQTQVLAAHFLLDFYKFKPELTLFPHQKASLISCVLFPHEWPHHPSL